MSQTFKARPTEYKGILYRSKCEAMFARFFDLKDDRVRGCKFDSSTKCNTQMQAGFVYEPRGLEIDGWVPDFLRWEISFSRKDLDVPRLLYHVIEYKPSRPTQAYANEFTKRCPELMSRLGGRVLCEIYFGSVYSSESDRGTFCGVREEWLDDNWMIGFESDIRSTRFDILSQ